MQTLSNIVKLIENFGTAHLQVETFSFGKMLDMADLKDYELPILHVVYTGSDTAEREKTYNFDVFVLSRVGEDGMPQEQYEMISDMELILHDLISEIKVPKRTDTFLPVENNLASTIGQEFREFERQYTDNNFQVGDVRSTPLVEERTGRFCGIRAGMSVTVSAPHDSCYTPYS